MNLKTMNPSEIMNYIFTHAVIGRWAVMGMFLSAFFIVLSLAGIIGFNPLVGFATVPLACILLGLKELLK